MRPEPRNTSILSFLLAISALTGILFAAGCGPNASYAVGGTVSGLVGTGLVLQNNSGNSLSVAANGTFTFTTHITSGSGYQVTVSAQPSSPAQVCTVTNGSGTVSNAAITNVTVVCPNYMIVPDFGNN